MHATRLPLLILIATFVFAFQLEGADTAIVSVGGTSIVLPIPEGFFRYDGKSTKVDRLHSVYSCPFVVEITVRSNPWLRIPPGTIALTNLMRRSQTAATVFPSIRALCRSFCDPGNVSVADRSAAEAIVAASRFFLRLRAIARCVLLRRGGSPRPESLQGALAKPALNRPEYFAFD